MDGLNILTTRIIYIIGFLGNLIGFFTFSMKSLSSFSNRNIFRCIALIHELYLICLITLDLADYLNYKIIESCKTYWYLNFLFTAISVWLFVFLTFEKFTSIQYPTIHFIKKKWFQITIICLIIIVHVFYLSPYNTFLQFKNENSEKNFITDKTNSDYFKKNVNCTLYDQTEEFSNIIKEVVNLAFIPYLTIVSLSILLIRSIFQLKSKISKMTEPTDKQLKTRFINSKTFAISSIILNFFLILFTLPIYLCDIKDFYKNNPLFYDLTLSFFYSSFCFVFYLLFIINSIFREQAFNLIKNKLKCF